MCGKESEAIKDIDLRSVSLLKPEGVSGVWFIFCAFYGGKPADKDGRAILQGDIELSPDEMGNWCFSYMGGWG